MRNRVAENPPKLKVALINVVLEGDYQYEQEIPLGLAYIGAFLREKGYEVTFKQCFALRAGQIDSVTEIKADVYGFQLNMVNYKWIKSVAEKIKANRPGAVIVFGGPFLISLSEDILNNEPLCDFIAMGEGELTILELLEAIEKKETNFSDIKGLIWRDSSRQVIRNQPRDLIADLDTLPFPARDFLETAERDQTDSGILESVRVVTSRGCVGKCSFCYVNWYRKFQKGSLWRGRSAKNVVDELEHLSKKYKARVFNFSDSSFEDPGEKGKARSRQICEEIIRRGLSISAKIYLRCETMRSEDDIELLKLYKRAGIDVVIIGAEAGSDYELRLYEKHATLEDNYRAAKILRDLDLFYVLTGFIMFGPDSTVDTLKSNIEFLYEFGFADNLMLAANVLMLIRDSKLYHKLKEEGRVIESGRCWELPKYQMKDPMAARMSKHWQNLFVRYPVTAKVNRMQINIGNLISRMTNPMNKKALDLFKEEYLELKSGYSRLSAKFGRLQRDHFLETIELIKKDCSDEELSGASEDFFIRTYGDHLPLYEDLYNGFVSKIAGSGISLSGLIFKHFLSAMTIKETERVKTGT